MGVIAEFPQLLDISFNLPADELKFSAKEGDKIRVWAGTPGYGGKFKDYGVWEHTIRLLKEFGREEGKFIVQLFEDDILLDENCIESFLLFKKGITVKLSRRIRDRF